MISFWQLSFESQWPLLIIRSTRYVQAQTAKVFVFFFLLQKYIGNRYQVQYSIHTTIDNKIFEMKGKKLAVGNGFNYFCFFFAFSLSYEIFLIWTLIHLRLAHCNWPESNVFFVNVISMLCFDCTIEHISQCRCRIALALPSSLYVTHIR